MEIDVDFAKETTLIRDCAVLPKVRHGDNFHHSDPEKFQKALEREAVLTAV